MIQLKSIEAQGQPFVGVILNNCVHMPWYSEIKLPADLTGGQNYITRSN